MDTASLHVSNAIELSAFYQQKQPMHSRINLGSDLGVTIAELAHNIARTAGYAGQVTFDADKPDGASRKCMDSSHLYALGWKPQIALQQGLVITYKDFVRYHA